MTENIVPLRPAAAGIAKLLDRGRRAEVAMKRRAVPRPSDPHAANVLDL
jgi:hypothetical protein